MPHKKKTTDTIGNAEAVRFVPAVCAANKQPGGSLGEVQAQRELCTKQKLAAI